MVHRDKNAIFCTRCYAKCMATLYVDGNIYCRRCSKLLREHKTIPDRLIVVDDIPEEKWVEIIKNYDKSKLKTKRCKRCFNLYKTDLRYQRYCTACNKSPAKPWYESRDKRILKWLEKKALKDYKYEGK